jgi:hypothetical protein
VHTVLQVPLTQIPGAPVLWVHWPLDVAVCRQVPLMEQLSVVQGLPSSAHCASETHSTHEGLLASPSQNPAAPPGRVHAVPRAREAVLQPPLLHAACEQGLLPTSQARSSMLPPMHSDRATLPSVAQVLLKVAGSHSAQPLPSALQMPLVQGCVTSWLPLQP